ncbi:MAG: helix-turn-helix domain-containing protein [Lachnospiraceae bacterium]
MPKPRTEDGGKNLISRRLIELRKRDNYSQRDLAYKLQLEGYDIDKNAITRIEKNNRYVSDFEIKALSDIFHVSYEYLIDGNTKSAKKYLQKDI